MAGAVPRTGHGCDIRITLNPSGSPNVFTSIDELSGPLSFKTTKANKKVTAHTRTVDVYVHSPELVRDAMALKFNYDPSDADHVALRDLALSNTVVGVAYLAPGGVLHVSDCIIQSGQLSSQNQTNDTYENERMLDLEFRPSGPFEVDGDLYT